MDDGISQEVCLHSTPDGHFFVELTSGDQRGWAPIESSQIEDVLASRPVQIGSDSCQCVMTPEGESVSILLNGIAEVRFTLAINHFAALAKTLAT